jgi:hypothetical protein
MGKAIRASLLILLFACSTQAGYIPNESPAPPPQPASVAQSGYIPNDAPAPPPADGWMGNGGAESLTQLTLDLLAVLPSLL